VSSTADRVAERVSDGAATAGGSQSDNPTGSYRAVLGVVVASTFLALAAYTGPLGNAVTLSEAFGTSPSGRTWILASMSVGLAVTMLPAGVIADRFGRRRVFQMGAALFVVANLACAATSSVVGFVAARIIGGVGATGMVATGLGLVASAGTDARRQATTAAWWSVAMGGGIAAGPILAGLLDLVDAWRGFYVIVAVGGLVTIAEARRHVPTHVPTEARTARRVDVVGVVLLLAFLSVLISAIVDVRTGVDSTTALLSAVALGLLAALVGSQLTGSRRLIELDLLRHRPFAASNLAGFGTGLGVVSVMAFVPTYLAIGLGRSTLAAGAMSTCWSATSAIAALALRRFTLKRTGPAQLVLGLLGVAGGMSLMAGVTSSSDTAPLVAGLVAAGVAAGVLNGGLARQAVATAPAQHVATGTAANNTARYLGASIGVTAASVMASKGEITAAWGHIVWAAVIVSVLTAVMVATLSRTGTKRSIGRPALNPATSVR